MATVFVMIVLVAGLVIGEGMRGTVGRGVFGGASNDHDRAAHGGCRSHGQGASAPSKEQTEKNGRDEARNAHAHL